jgi:hypothetical protein
MTYGAQVSAIFSIIIVVPWFSAAYAYLYAMLCNLTFGVLGLHGSFSMEVLEVATAEADVAVHMVSGGRSQTFMGSARSHGFIDTAFVIALLGATTLAPWKRLKAVGTGVAVLQVFVAGKFGLATWLFVADDSWMKSGGARVNASLFHNNLESGLIFAMVTAAVIVSLSLRSDAPAVVEATSPAVAPEPEPAQPARKAPKKKRKKKKRSGKGR